MPKDKKESKKKSKDVPEDVIESKKGKEDDQKSENSEHSEHENEQEQSSQKPHFPHGYAKCLDYDEEKFEHEYENMVIKDMDIEDILKYARCIGKKKKNITVVDGCEITIKKMNGEFKHKSIRHMHHAPAPFNGIPGQFPPRQPFQRFPPFQQQQFQQMNQQGIGGGRPFYQRKPFNQRPGNQQEHQIDGADML